MKADLQTATDNTLSSPQIVTETIPWAQTSDVPYYRIVETPDDFVLYKYGKRKYLEACLKDGIVSFGIATTYNNPLLTPGQQDNEVSRHYTPDPEQHVILAGPSQAPIKNVTNIKITLPIKGRDGEPFIYYMWCASRACDPIVAKDFEAECFIKIKNSKEFFRRLEAACRSLHPRTTTEHGCDFYGRDVSYWDKNAPPPTSKQLELIFLKDKSYEHQKEFRIMFAIDPKKSTESRIYFSIGNIEDIAEICELDQMKLLGRSFTIQN